MKVCNGSMFVCNCQALPAVDRFYNLKPESFVLKLTNMSLPCNKTAAELPGKLNINEKLQQQLRPVYTCVKDELDYTRETQ